MYIVSCEYCNQNDTPSNDLVVYICDGCGTCQCDDCANDYTDEGPDSIPLCNHCGMTMGE